jgi:hypothetical protein
METTIDLISRVLAPFKYAQSFPSIAAVLNSDTGNPA